MTAKRSVWVRPLGGHRLNDKQHYWTTGGRGFPVPAWAQDGKHVPLPFASGGAPLAVGAFSIAPLGSVASDTPLSWVGVALPTVLRLVAPDVGADGGFARRCGLLTGYARFDADELQVSEWTGEVDSFVQVGRETMLVTGYDEETGKLYVDRDPVLRTDHASPYGAPKPLFPAEAVGFKGQWVEWGYSDASGDHVVWRGVVDSVNLTTAAAAFTARPLTSVLREHVSRAAGSVAFKQGANTSDAPRRAVYASAIDTLSWLEDPGETDEPWPVARIIDKSGKWVMVAIPEDAELPSAAFQRVDAPYRRRIVYLSRTTIVALGARDSVTRVTGVGTTVRLGTADADITGEEAAEAASRNFLQEVIANVSHVERGFYDDSTRVDEMVNAFLSPRTLSAGFHAGIPAQWVTTTLALARQQYLPASFPSNMPYLPATGSFLDWLGTSFFGNSGLFLTQDMGCLTFDTWEEIQRDFSGIDVSVSGANDRLRNAAWQWTGYPTEPVSFVTVDDTSLSTEYAMTGALYVDSNRQVRSRANRVAHEVNTRTKRLFVDANTWLDGSNNTLSVKAPFGLSGTAEASLQSILATFCRPCPALTLRAAEVSEPLVGKTVRVQLFDLPSPRELYGTIYTVERRIGEGTCVVTVLLASFNRPATPVWAPTLEVLAVLGPGSASVSGDTALFGYPGTLAVYSSEGERKEDLTGAALSGASLTWDTGSLSTGDFVTFPDRFPEQALPYGGGIIGYIPTEEDENEGDATWA